MGTILFLFYLLFGVHGLKPVNNATLGTLPTKERNRRLVPYMTYYLSQPQNQPYRTMMAVPYLAVPQYRQLEPQRYIQQPSSLTRMITQNYLALSKPGNTRFQTRLNLDYPQDIKYFLPVQNPQSNLAQYQRAQYIKPQLTEQIYNQQDTDYNQQEDEPQNNVHYAKPPADEIIQFAKPEVQRYVTKYNEPVLQYTKQEAEYDAEPQNPVSQYINRPVQPKQYTIKAEDAIVPYYLQKQFVGYLPKGQLKLSPHLPNEQVYAGKSFSEYNPQSTKGDQTTVSITQSQEIEVEPMPSTPTPITKYHAKFVSNPESYSPYNSYYDDKREDDIEEEELLDRNLNDILRGGVSLSKSLPERITSENLDSSIKTLSKILKILQAAHSLPNSAKTIIENFPNPNEVRFKESKKLLHANQPKDDRGSTPGRPGIDYPIYDVIPQTQFSCKEQRYKGFFGDPETKCQVWHYCDLNGGQASFLCPNGTIFSQVALTCDWWFNVKCASTAQLYVLNERLYKFILPQKPSFPEDYTGPLVDHYLTEKFREIEHKNKNKTEENKNNDEEFEPPYSIDSVSQNKVRSAGQ